MSNVVSITDGHSVRTCAVCQAAFGVFRSIDVAVEGVILPLAILRVRRELRRRHSRHVRLRTHQDVRPELWSEPTRAKLDSEDAELLTHIHATHEGNTQ